MEAERRSPSPRPPTPEALGFPEPSSAPAAADPPLDAGAEDSPSDPQADAGDGGLQEETGAASSGASPVLTDDLRDQIVRQVEYYFSDENLPTDKFLLKYVRKNKEGYVPIAVISSFRRMKKLVQDLSLIEAALRTSSQLAVSQDGRKVRRLHPLSVNAIPDNKSRTVVVENFLEDYSTENIQRIFGNIGNITSITIHDPHAAEESSSTGKTEMSISNKLHALVEYDKVEAAESAVATLNDEKNWRSGMRVELLLKRMGKYGLIQKAQKGNKTSETTADGQKSEHHEEIAVKEELEHSTCDKGGGRRGRYKSRGRGYHQQIVNGQDRGHDSTGSNNNDGASRPILGPRMPDGTRGFAVGRGKPSVSSSYSCQDA